MIIDYHSARVKFDYKCNCLFCVKVKPIARIVDGVQPDFSYPDFSEIRFHIGTIRNFLPNFSEPDFDKIRFHIGKIGNFFLPLDVIVTLILHRTL